MRPIRFIFGCKHENRTIFYHTFFERGLKIPAAFCEDCLDECDEKINAKSID